LFSGNGVELHQELIQQTFAGQAVISTEPLAVCSAKQIATMALEFWNKQENLTNKVYPLYLKEQTFAVRTKNF